MKKVDLRRNIEQMETFKFGKYDKHHDKLSEVISYVEKAEVLKLINQLDEPEVLTPEWIDEHVDYADVRGGTQAFIHVDDLQNLLVPTLSELEKVQLSQKTADELNRYKELGYSLKDLLVIAGSKQAQEKLARAWLDGYTVEEEQKYIVELPTNRENVFDEPDFYRPRAAIGRMDNGLLTVFKTRDGTNLKLHDIYLLTEQEIKDYDERFWPFAVKIEELEG